MTHRPPSLVAALAALLAAACGDAPPPHAVDGTITVSSAAFDDEQPIPPVHGCDEEGLSPPLEWSGVPDAAAEIVLAVEHVNVPFKGRVIHWLAYGMPPTRTSLEASIPIGDEIEGGGRQGVNEHGEHGWMPPCPPIGEGRYAFFVYALDEETGLEAGATRDELVAALEGRVLAGGELVGTLTR